MADALAEINEEITKILSTVPSAIRPQTKLFLATKNYLFRGNYVSFVFTIEAWFDQGLSKDDYLWCLNAMFRPDYCARHKGEWDLMADLASLVSERMKIARSKRESKQRAEAEKQSGSVAAVVTGLADYFNRGT